MHRIRTILIVCVFSCMCEIGCKSRTVRVPVEGTVMLDGKPIAEAAVTFMPRAPGQLGVAVTDDVGRFVLQEAGMRPGIEPGEYDVVIVKAEGPVGPPVQAVPASEIADPASFDTVQPTAVDRRPTRFIVPERYGSRQTSGLRATIAGGTKELVFSLTKKP
jgi:hypothetical protein